MANNISGNNDRPGGGNDTYSIPGRGSQIPRKQVVREVKQGKHPNFSTVKHKGNEFVRAKPDNSTSNNVNKEGK